MTIPNLVTFDPSTYGCFMVFPRIGVPQNGWLKMENPIEVDDLGVPLFLENTHIAHFDPLSDVDGDPTNLL